MTNNLTLAEWAKDNGVTGIRFYPSNPSQASATEILDGAAKAVQAIDAGRVSEYKDSVHSV
jgi:hypothetical protein